jgi:carbon storage regulator CsrA
VLAVSRHIGEDIRIGKDIVVTLISVKGKLVCLGISAPRHFKITRGPERKLNAPVEGEVSDE